MSKAKRNIKTITDRKTFKRVWLSKELSCPICGPNKGCNRARKKIDKCWKQHRKTKWK